MSAFDGVVGQPAAVAALRAAAVAPVHAYLLVGPAGTGKRSAATAFAAALLCPDGGDGTCEVCQRVLAGRHPDVVVVEREGASIDVKQARRIVGLASTSPVEGARKVLVLTDFDRVDEAAPALLKTIEEPPATTVFVLLAEQVPPELVTIASRSVRIDLRPLPPEVVAGVLVEEGLAADHEAALVIADAAAGRLDRARLLASDPSFAARRARWRTVPAQLDGRGATVFDLAAELLSGADAVLVPLHERQAAELAALAEREKATGERGGSRKDLEARHKREQRRLRTDELRAGLAALSVPYRERLGAGDGPSVRRAMAALEAISAAGEALLRNPNEALLLQALLLRLTA